jgi:hypothetical protein
MEKDWRHQRAPADAGQTDDESYQQAADDIDQFELHEYLRIKNLCCCGVDIATGPRRVSKGELLLKMQFSLDDIPKTYIVAL